MTDATLEETLQAAIKELPGGQPRSCLGVVTDAGMFWSMLASDCCCGSCYSLMWMLSGALVLDVVKQPCRGQDYGYDMLASWLQRICTYVRTQSTKQPCEIQVMVMDMVSITRVTGAALWVM